MAKSATGMRQITNRYWPNRQPVSIWLQKFPFKDIFRSEAFYLLVSSRVGLTLVRTRTKLAFANSFVTQVVFISRKRSILPHKQKYNIIS